MVAYSFKERFVEAVASGAKRQTIRAPRKSRHARAGDPLTFYTGPRMKPRLIGRGVCRRTADVELDLARSRVSVWEDGRLVYAVSEHDADSRANLDAFAQRDGFASWAEMRGWFRETHATETFRGCLIQWEPAADDTAHVVGKED